MKSLLSLSALLFFIMASCGPTATPEQTKETQSEPTTTETLAPNFVSTDVEINASKSRVWEIITNPAYAKILGAEFDKNAFMESDYKLGSRVYFKYEPDRVVTTGTITKLTKEEYIQIDYSFPGGFEYTERISIEENQNGITLKIYAGPYTEDLEAQKIVWKNWLLKVKELSETETL